MLHARVHTPECMLMNVHMHTYTQTQTHVISVDVIHMLIIQILPYMLKYIFVLKHHAVYCKYRFLSLVRRGKEPILKCQRVQQENYNLLIHQKLSLSSCQSLTLCCIWSENQQSMYRFPDLYNNGTQCCYISLKKQYCQGNLKIKGVFFLDFMST